MTRGRRLLLWLVPLALGAAVLLWPEAAPGPTGAWLGRLGLQPRADTVAGHRVRYVRTGEGPPVVLLHGFAASIYSWRDLIPALARQHEVVALDFPAFGGSEVPAQLARGELPAVVTGLMDHLGIARASLVGNSMGGAVAATVAATRPERVDRLVLVDAAGFIQKSQRPWLLRVAGNRAGNAVLERLPLRRRLTVMALRQVYADPSRVTPEQVEEYLAPLSRPGMTAALASLLASSDDSGFPELARQIRAPTLVLWGEKDAWIPVAQADLFVAAIPGARKVILSGCGHVPQEECADRLAPLVIQFLAAPSAPGAS
jgi:pimeloyl-ACP methyl ester carboxylesterase